MNREYAMVEEMIRKTSLLENTCRGLARVATDMTDALTISTKALTEISKMNSDAAKIAEKALSEVSKLVGSHLPGCADRTAR